MTKNENNKNAFLKNIGAVSRTKNGWQNYPTGSPANQNRQGTINEQLDYWKGQKIHIDDITNNLSYEIALLNFKNYPITTKNHQQKRCTHYFRSHSDKRLVGAYLTLTTFKNKWVTQKQVLERFPHLKKAFVSLIFKHCIEECWFNSKPTELSSNILCYQVCDMMVNSAKEYYNFCMSIRNELEFIQ